jgi:hypothetical protein
LIEWTVGLGDQPSFGHVYGWQLDAVSKLSLDPPRSPSRSGFPRRTVGAMALTVPSGLGF